MKKNHTIPVLIFSAIVMILAFSLFIFFLRVIENKNEHTVAVLTTLQEKLKEKEDSILFAGKVAELKSTQESINNYFVDPNKIDTFVSYLEGIGGDLDSTVSVKSIEIPAKTKNLISIKVSISGTFQNVMNTITFLENIPHQINITQIYLNEDRKEIVQDDFKVTTKTKDRKMPIWQADVSFNILSL